MTKFLALTILLFAFPCIALGISKDTLDLKITMTVGERGRDSHSETTTITVDDHTVIYEKSFAGMLRRQAPERKEFKLEEKDRKAIIALIKERTLLVTKSLEREQASKGPFNYFELSLDLEINGSKGKITIKGPRNATDMKEMKLFKDSVALIQQVYLVMDSADNKMSFEPLIY